MNKTALTGALLLLIGLATAAVTPVQAQPQQGQQQLNCYVAQEGVVVCNFTATPVNETNMTLQNQTMNETNLTEGNQTNLTPQEERPEGFADLFYAYDADGNYLTLVINNQGQVTNVLGSVGSINELDQDSLIACEYFMQLERLGSFEDPTRQYCSGYEGLQNKVQQGMVPYLTIQDSRIEIQDQ